MNFDRILVVCAGNICRSPMAEGLLKATFPSKKIHSAGIVGMVGHAADPLSVRYMNEIGVDISQHRARQLDQTILRDADVILAMSQEQVRIIEHTWPFTRGKVLRLCHWNAKDVPDPYQQPEAAFALVRDLVVQGVRDWEKRI